MSIKEHWRRGFAAKDRRAIHEWAQDNFVCLPPLTRQGRFDAARSRHFIDIFAALQDDAVRAVNILKPTGSGGTLITDIFLAWTIANDPGPFMYAFNSDKIADEHAEARLMPALEFCHPVRELLPYGEERYKKRKSEIIFRNRMALYVIGPSWTHFQNKRIRYLVLDEIWDYKRGTIGEAKGRLADYLEMQISKLVCCSQGGQAGDDWHEQFNSGEVFEWLIQCQSCGHFMQPRWSARRSDRTKWGMVWEDCRTKDGYWDIRAAIKTVRFECERCGFKHLESAALKDAWNATGKYVRTQEGDPRVRSFHFTSIPFNSWTNALSVYLAARNMDRQGIVIQTVQFFQKHMAEFYDPEKTADFELIAPKEATSDGEKFWEHQDFIFLGVDVQQDCLWALVAAYGKTGDVMILWADKLHTWEDVARKQAEFKVQPRCVFVDARHRQQEVYTQCTLHGQAILTAAGNVWYCWNAIKGSDRTEFIFTHKSGPRKGMKERLPYLLTPGGCNPCLYMQHDDPLKPVLVGKRCRQYYWSNPWLFDVMADYRKRFSEGRGAFVAPAVSEHFSNHLSALKKVEEKDGYGMTKWKWDNGQRPDHLADCFCFTITAAFIVRAIGSVSADAPGA